MKVMPTCCWMALSSICISSRSLRSRAPSGSSRSSTRGRFTSARASATRWRWPPDSCAGLALVVALEADHPERLGDARGALGLGDLADHQPVRHVVADGHVREQRVVLEDRVDVALERRHGRDVLAVEQDRAGASAARSRRSSAASSSCPSRTARASRRTRRRGCRGRCRRPRRRRGALLADAPWRRAGLGVVTEGLGHALEADGRRAVSETGRVQVRPRPVGRRSAAPGSTGSRVSSEGAKRSSRSRSRLADRGRA